MCGICGCLLPSNFLESRKCVKRNIALLHSRGPDGSGLSTTDSSILGHTRLAIVGLESGSQPLVENDVYLTINGEIYNYDKLYENFKELRTDCDVILKLWNKLPLEPNTQFTYTTLSNIEKEYNGERLASHNEKCIMKMLNSLQGDYAFCLVDDTRKFHLIARDPIGVVPLYYAYNDNNEEIGFASEMKCLKQYKNIVSFPPGAYYDGERTSASLPLLKRWYTPEWKKIVTVERTENELLTNIQQMLIQATQRRLMSDVGYGVLLSGGLDSSVIASICAQLNKNGPIDTFSVGLEGSVDMKYARVVAQHIGSRHHECVFTLSEALNVVPTVIQCLETYDITTIRASTPMYLLSKFIASKGFKVVLSGEGSDEIFGGYLYFHDAPNPYEFRKESVRRVNELHLFDCLRANKSCMANGVEVRVPFLDKDFLNETMTIDTKLCIKNGIEKWILREAFKSYLPPEIAWRQKEQFSDGVGYNWIDSLKEHANKIVSDDVFKNAAIEFPYNTPTTKEAYWYRNIFSSQFTESAFEKTVKKWEPTWGANKDPSGRATRVHLDSVYLDSATKEIDKQIRQMTDEDFNILVEAAYHENARQWQEAFEEGENDDDY